MLQMLQMLQHSNPFLCSFNKLKRTAGLGEKRVGSPRAPGFKVGLRLEKYSSWLVILMGLLYHHLYHWLE